MSTKFVDGLLRIAEVEGASRKRDYARWDGILGGLMRGRNDVRDEYEKAGLAHASCSPGAAKPIFTSLYTFTGQVYNEWHGSTSVLFERPTICNLQAPSPSLTFLAIQRGTVHFDIMPSMGAHYLGDTHHYLSTHLGLRVVALKSKATSALPTPHHRCHIMFWQPSGQQNVWNEHIQPFNHLISQPCSPVTYGIVFICADPQAHRTSFLHCPSTPVPSGTSQGVKSPRLVMRAVG